jgi:hypothetical protein
MSFQAPYSITDMRRLQMAEAQQKDAQQQAMMEGINQGIMTLMGGFAENQAMNAKGKAYGDFLKSHGQQLGFQPEYLENLLKQKPRDLAMVGDSILMGNMGNRMMSLNHLNRQAELYPGRGAGGGAGGGGAGGGQKGYMPGQGWVGYGN